MINELSRLSESIKGANIETEIWHPKLLTIPRIKPDAPCVRILLKNRRVSCLRPVSADLGKTLRKYGDHGSFPFMNLAPLYRISDKNTSEKISAWIKANGAGTDIQEIRSWCVENNWGKKLTNNYRISICNRADELMTDTGGVFEPLNELIEAVNLLRDPAELHHQLCHAAFVMIENGEDVRLALQTLFYLAKPDKPGDSGNLSVIFDSWELEEKGAPTISPTFTRGLNSALLAKESDMEFRKDCYGCDAFGLPYREAERTMPKVALPVGFDVILRTMYSGQPCQHRYGKIESDSYPLSYEKTMEIKSSLEWLAQKSNQNKTWVKTGKSEAFFAYPSKIPFTEDNLTTVQPFAGNSENLEADFLAIAQNFSEFITETKKQDPDNYPEHIQLFALNKYDKARTRVSYSRSTTPETVIDQSQTWRKAAANLPPLWRLDSPKALFPLAVAPVLNRVWKRDGMQASDKYRHTDKYYGVDLFFGVPKSVLLGTLSELVHNAENMAVYASMALRSKNRDTKSIAFFLKCLKETLSLMGMHLYWLGIGKDDYMNEYPYLFGQLLKISDAVHELYCVKVRKGVPTQLVGSTMYNAAAEMPLQTLVLLSTRIQPYLSWCKANRQENMAWTDKSGRRHDGLSAGYYLRQYEIIANKLKSAFSAQTRFSDTEKAQLFIGYLASFEKIASEKTDYDQDNEGENDNE